jgi:hypothetical protein
MKKASHSMSRRPLSLGRETVRNLDPHQLLQAAGGISIHTVAPTFCTCNPVKTTE